MKDFGGIYVEDEPGIYGEVDFEINGRSAKLSEVQLENLRLHIDNLLQQLQATESGE